MLLRAIPSFQAALACDHDRLAQMFESFCRLRHTAPGRAREAFEHFRADLSRHVNDEETVLYPLAESKIGEFGIELAEVLRQEHRAIRAYVETIASRLKDPGADTSAAEEALADLLARHQAKEEQGLYPKLDRMLNDDETAQLRERWASEVADQTRERVAKQST